MASWITRLCAAAISATFMLLVAGCGGGGGSSSPTYVVVAGSLDRPAVMSLSDIEARPAVTQTDNYLNGTTPQTKTYVGANLWSLLDSTGIQVDPARKNDILNRYVLATGSDGYKVVFALGEINPDFGNRSSLVAYSEIVNGSRVPLIDDGFVRVTAPGDLRGGRYVSGLARLDVRGSGSVVPASGGGTTSQFAVSGMVKKPGTFNLAALQALPKVTRTVGASVYGGVSLWDFLNATVGLNANAAVKNDVLGMYVVATGSDGYKALLAMGEIEPNFGNQPDIIAYEVDGVPLTGNGFARLVIPNDVKAGRYVSNLISIEVFTAPVAPL